MINVRTVLKNNLCRRWTQKIERKKRKHKKEKSKKKIDILWRKLKVKKAYAERGKDRKSIKQTKSQKKKEKS